MAIVKVKIKEKAYVQILKSSLEDERLTWQATAVLTYLVGKYDNWEINLHHLAKVKRNGMHSTREALMELRRYEYCHLFSITKDGRRVDTAYVVFEEPTSIEEAINSHIQVEEGHMIHYMKPSEKISKIEKVARVATDEEKELEEKIIEQISLKEKAENLFYEGKNYREIGEIISVTHGTVRSWSSRGNWKEKKEVLQHKNKSVATVLQGVAKKCCSVAVQQKKSPIKWEVLPESDFPNVEKPNAENHYLNNKESNNKEINNKNHDHDKEHEKDLDLEFNFNSFFSDELEIPFTKTNQESILKLLKNQSVDSVVKYLLELKKNLKDNPQITNYAGVFTSKLKKGERQLAYNTNFKKASTSSEDSPVDLPVRQEVQISSPLPSVEEQPQIYEEPVRTYNPNGIKPVNYETRRTGAHIPAPKITNNLEKQASHFENIEKVKKLYSDLSEDVKLTLDESLKIKYIKDFGNPPVDKIEAFIPYKLWKQTKLISILIEGKSDIFI